MNYTTKLNIAACYVAIFSFVVFVVLAMGYGLVQLVREIERSTRPAEIEQPNYNTPRR